MDQNTVLNLFRSSGALLEGHFRLTSGLHSPGYLQCALVLQHPHHAEALGRALAAKLPQTGATVVLSPALGGLIIGHEVARALSLRAIFAERQDGKLTLRRGFTLSESDRVIEVARRHGKFAGCGGNRSVERQTAAIRSGALFVTTQTDIGFLMSAAQQWVGGVRAQLQSPA